MTEDEIVKVTKIAMSVDNFCDNCGSDLIEQLQQAFPEYLGTIQGIWDKREVYEQLYRQAQVKFWDDNGPLPRIADICI